MKHSKGLQPSLMLESRSSFMAMTTTKLPLCKAYQKAHNMYLLVGNYAEGKNDELHFGETP